MSLTYSTDEIFNEEIIAKFQNVTAFMFKEVNSSYFGRCFSTLDLTRVPLVWNGGLYVNIKVMTLLLLFKCHNRSQIDLIYFVGQLAFVSAPRK